MVLAVLATRTDISFCNHEMNRKLKHVFDKQMFYEGKTLTIGFKLRNRCQQCQHLRWYAVEPKS